MHPRELYKLRDDGKIIQLSRGVFRRVDAPAATWPDLIGVQQRTPIAVTCCVSAAMVHDLTDELPGKVQFAVPRGVRPPQIRYPPTQVMRFDPATFELGLTSVEAAPGENVRVYDPARTTVDLIRLRHRLGEATAYGALRRYLRTRGADPAMLLELADQLGVFGPVRYAVDVVSAG
jgi:predicted transcriptional regulator of viral defense system